MSKIVVIGAGKTGRGFIGRLLKEADQEVLFVDKNTGLVDKLNATGQFTVSFFGNSREAVIVDNYSACTWEHADLTDAELIFVSVCGQNLADVGAQLNRLLPESKKVRIITCENASHPSKTLKNTIPDKPVAVSEATVFCTTIENGELDISSENYPYLQCDADLLEGYVPPVASVRAIGEFSNFLTRKLYTYNAASCVIAYVGAVMGYTDYGAAANDPLILQLLDKNYAATNRAMCARFGYELQDQTEFALLSKKKFCDRTIVDTVARNAREPHRKLAAGERIVGAASLLREQGEDASVLELTAAAAVLYEDAADKVWSGIQAERSHAEILKTVCGLAESDPLYQRILCRIQALTEDKLAAIHAVL